MPSLYYGAGRWRSTICKENGKTFTGIGFDFLLFKVIGDDVEGFLGDC